MQFLQDFWTVYGDTISNLLLAVVLLVAGWLLAIVLRGIVRRLMQSSAIDERLSNAVSMNDGMGNVSLQNIVPTGIFWITMLFVLVAFFNVLALWDFRGLTAYVGHEMKYLYPLVSSQRREKSDSFRLNPKERLVTIFSLLLSPSTKPLLARL